MVGERTRDIVSIYLLHPQNRFSFTSHLAPRVSHLVSHASGFEQYLTLLVVKFLNLNHALR